MICIFLKRRQRLFKAFHGGIDHACAYLAHTGEPVSDTCIDHPQHIQPAYLPDIDTRRYTLEIK